jgi:hypothetical protein|tara:strand:+ start:353 stop:550 length:198 start_codon:yes stop_codon:yes gene_type:complete
VLDFIVKMIYNDIMNKEQKIKKLENLAKACAEADDDNVKKMWFDKLIDLAKKYDMRDFVMNKLVH